MLPSRRATVALAAAVARAQNAPVSAIDPYIWLEDKDGAGPLAWVEAENGRTLTRLQNDTYYADFHREALAIASAPDRIPMPELTGDRVLNFWRDADHPRGLWRWTTQADYASPEPRWTTLLDVDALGRDERKAWVWKGAIWLPPDERLCLVALSEGGEDAISLREFDLAAGGFVEDGFVLPTSKQRVSWLDRDTLLVARDWGAGTMTASGYPFVLKRLRRGQPLAAAEEVYRGGADDQVSTGASLLTDAAGHRAVIITRGVTFFGAETLLLSDAGPVKLDLPARARVVGLIDGRLIFTTSEDWGDVPAGAIAAAPLAEVERGMLAPRVIFAPGPRQSVDGLGLTRSTLLLVVSDNVRGRAFVYAPQDDGGWSARPLALPDNASIAVAAATDRSDRAYLSVTGFLQPTALHTLDAGGAEQPLTVRTLPPRFDASRHVVEQHEAASSDGVRIPYFVVRPRDRPLDGSTPTLMTAYGGFELPMTPAYSGITGKLWLERGGAFVLANIRGGGEFGPAWHDAGRKTKRQIIYDDFAAVARDLFGRGLTSPARLGIHGGSNGGLLMGVEFNQHPELWGAVAIQVPLLDMERFERIAAGASWVDEYGSMNVPEEAAFLANISPYANLRRGVACPEPYIWTTTKDDRVGPQHARKFAARMKEYGLPYLFYEDTAGGHSGDADIAQAARLQALQMTYFARKLMDAPTAMR